MEYPYQIVTFLDNNPEKGQLIYCDESGGWLAQLALKRRFALKGIDEEDLIERLRDFCAQVPQFEIETTTLQKPERMPVEVIPVREPSLATQLHQDFLQKFDEVIISKYVDREGENYFPHITAQYWDKYVIDVVKYENKKFPISTVWLVKDNPNEQDTRAFRQFELKALNRG